jgi:hypothetical protein
MNLMVEEYDSMNQSLAGDKTGQVGQCFVTGVMVGKCSVMWAPGPVICAFFPFLLCEVYSIWVAGSEQVLCSTGLWKDACWCGIIFVARTVVESGA